MRATSLAAGNPRQGVILLVVLAMITLLTILGITFVLYSDASEATARINMEGERSAFQVNPINYSAYELMQHAFGQLVFGVEDDDVGQQSALRGHDLARDMYGYRYSGLPQTAADSAVGVQTANHLLENNDRPFRGTGRLSNSFINLTGGPLEEKKAINFSTFFNGFSGAGSSEFVRDPERPNQNSRSGTVHNYVGGFNPPYTYPDLNHVFLAKVDPATGEVIEPSFVRREAMDTQNATIYNQGPLGFNSATQAPAWTSANGKYQILRPRPADHSTAGQPSQFPGPIDDFGDVRNLPWGTHNDAVWIDLGVTPSSAPSGKKYKPLFAFTILDLDGRVNVNAHGNIHGRNLTGTVNGTHASRHGMGNWEVSLEKALTDNSAYTSNNHVWKNILLGGGGIQGRFQSSGITSSNFFPIPTSTFHSHGPVDFNSSTDTTPALSIPICSLPSLNSNWFYSPFSQMIQNLYGNGGNQEILASSTATNFNHGAIFNPFGNYPTDSPPHKLFSHSHLGMLLGKKTRNAKEYETESDLWKLNDGTNQTNRLFGSAPFDSISIRDKRYDRITTMSWDLDRPGMVAYIQDKSSQSLAFSPSISNQWNPSAHLGSTPGQGYPDSSNSPAIPFNLSGFTATSDYDSQYQSLLASAKRLNLQRALPPYPKQINPGDGQYLGNPSPNLSGDKLLALNATIARQDFAKEIFILLCQATGAVHPSEFSTIGIINSTDQKYLASRWLAQVAVNLVDNFDEDHVMTVFQWDTSGIPTLASEPVVGVELNRLQINETYVQVENKPGEHSSGNAPTGYRAKVYLELLNPLLDDPNHDHSAAVQIGTNYIYTLELVRPDFLSNVGLTNNLYPSNQSKMVGPTDPTTQRFTNQFINDSDFNMGGPLANSGPLPVIQSNMGPIDFKLKPNNGAAVAASGMASENGFVVVGPTPTPTGEGNSLGAGWNNPNSGLQSAGPEFTTLINTWKVGDFFPQDKLCFPLTKTVGLGNTLLTDANLNNLNPANLPAVLLRRLANPYMPLDDTNPNSPTYNPYVTVDVVQITKQMVENNDARKKIPNGMMSASIPNMMATPVGSRESYGRFISNHHPFIFGTTTSSTSALGGLLAQNPQPMPLPNEPKHTFWRHNYKDTANGPSSSGDTFSPPRFQQHLDRPPISIGEILSVPTCKPHEVYWLNNSAYDVSAGWLDPKTRLYRFLEMVQAGNVRYLQDSSGNRIPIGSEGGRVSGKINLNTCTREVFRALCDQNPNHRFTPTQVDEIFNKIEALRPFWGFGLGGFTQTMGVTDYLGFNSNQAIPTQAPVRGVTNSLLNNQLGDTSDPMNLWSLLVDPQNIGNNSTLANQYPALFGTNRSALTSINPGEIPPSVRLELFNKIVGNSTTRSNCFAVWVTVGFFEVVSEDGVPGQFTQKYILGKELQPRTRKRFFSMIDRTQLETWRKSVDSGGPTFTGNVTLFSLGLGNSFTSPVTGKTYPIIPASPVGTIPANQATILTINPGTIFEETVEVENIPMVGVGVRLKNTHTVPFEIINRGNPGPIPREKVDLDDFQRQGLIPYFQVLE